ncbi:hypothetical protein AAMO2058_000604700 [Amorphochlora amoebiformis]
MQQSLNRNLFIVTIKGYRKPLWDITRRGTRLEIKKAPLSTPIVPTAPALAAESMKLLAWLAAFNICLCLGQTTRPIRSRTQTSGAHRRSSQHLHQMRRSMLGFNVPSVFGRKPCPTPRQSLVFTDDLDYHFKRLINEKKKSRGGAETKSLPAIAFDIDGVFKMGGKYTDFGAAAIRKVIDAGIPYVLMTNGGGGRSEEEYSKEVNKKLEMFDIEGGDHHEYVTPERMILSYTPFNKDLEHLKNEPVLVVGSRRVIDLANHYGFRKSMHMSEYTCKHPLMNPFGQSGLEKDDCVINMSREEWEEDFKAVLVFTDPEDFFEGIQVITDVLLSSRPGEVEYEPKRRIPVVFSNPDLLWKTQYPHSRFGQGAFRLALEACYRARLDSLGLSKEEIEVRLGDFVQYGKPEIVQFMHTKRAILSQAQRLGCDVSHYYMVGDNPTSDIQGATNMDIRAIKKGDKRWSGILVKTGVYKDGDDPLEANIICDNVLEAVDKIIAAHQDEIIDSKEEQRRYKDSIAT